MKNAVIPMKTIQHQMFTNNNNFLVRLFIVKTNILLFKNLGYNLFIRIFLTQFMRVY